MLWPEYRLTGQCGQNAGRSTATLGSPNLWIWLIESIDSLGFKKFNNRIPMGLGKLFIKLFCFVPTAAATAAAAAAEQRAQKTFSMSKNEICGIVRAHAKIHGCTTYFRGVNGRSKFRIFENAKL